MGKEMGLKGGRRGRDRAALVMLWAEAELPELRGWQIAGWKDVVEMAVLDPALGMITLWEMLLTLVSGAGPGISAIPSLQLP